MKKIIIWGLMISLCITLVLGMKNRTYANTDQNGIFTEAFYVNQSMSLNIFFFC